LIASLGLFAVSAMLLSAIVAYLLVSRFDDQQDQERRTQLVTVIADVRATGGEVSELDPQFLRSLERMFGLRDLRFEAELPSNLTRETQPALDRDGRIVGWFTWERERSMAQALAWLLPFLVASAAGLVGFGVVALLQIRRSVRELGASERRAWRLANEDPLTALPNQRKTLELIEPLLADRAAGEAVSLGIVDVDGLSEINAAHGRHIGDALLVCLAERLREAPGQLVGRIGDDEFVLVMTNADAAVALRRFSDVLAILTRSYAVGEHSLQIGITTGLAHALRDGISAEDLVRCADLALRAAKRKNRGGILEFHTAMEMEFSERRFIERELRLALAAGALDVHYQPIVKGDGSVIVGVEALARWTHPQRGEISPVVFIPVAEQAGLMGRLGEFVLRRALADAKDWPSLSVSVNVSAVQVRDPGLVDAVARALIENGIEPSRCILEMTESVLIDNPVEAKRSLDALRAIGVQLALDDFGTGYSSLTYLQRFRFDKLKIDQGFVQPLGTTRGGDELIQAIVALGHAQGLKVVAEGVETEGQRVLLRLAGCEEMQGFLFAKPGPRETIDRLLANVGAPAASRRIRHAAANGG
jgi:diguanylate cyclase (GGDEF)-like protein